MIIFTDDQQDALREIANLAMGEAGVSLSKVLNVYVQLSIPLIHFVEFDQVIGVLTTLNSDLGPVISIVRLGFQGFLEGEALLIYGPSALKTVTELLGNTSPEDTQEGMLLREISNILAAACLNGIARRLSGDILITPPSMYSHRMPAVDSFDIMFGKHILHWHETLITKISFSIEQQNFQCNLIVFLSERCIEKLRVRLDQILTEM